MPADLTIYDRALHESPALSVQMAERLLIVIKTEVAAGTISREVAREHLARLYELYAEQDCVDEREAVADVLDVFDGWAPLRAAI